MAIDRDLRILLTRPWKLTDHSKAAVKDIIVDGWRQTMPIQELRFEIQVCDDDGTPVVGFWIKDIGSSIVKHLVECHNAQVETQAEENEKPNSGILFDTPPPKEETKTPQEAALEDLSMERLREVLRL